MKSPATKIHEIQQSIESYLEQERSRSAQLRGYKNDLQDISLDVTKILELLKELYDFVMQNIPPESMPNYGVITRVEDQLLELGTITKRTL